jgi:hypothetical protein
MNIIERRKYGHILVFNYQFILIPELAYIMDDQQL